MLGQVFAPVKQATKLPVPPIASKVVLEVNGAKVNAEEVESLLWDWRRDEVMDEMISYILVIQEAQKKSIVATDAEVEARVNKELTDHGMTADMLAKQAFPKSRTYMRFKTLILLVKMIKQGIDYNKLYKVSVLSIRPPAGAPPAGLADAEKRANEAAKKLQAGEAWAKVYEAYAPKDQLFQRLGAVGWVDSAEFPDGLKKAVAPIKSTGITGAVKTDGGFQILKIEGWGGTASPADKTEIGDAQVKKNIGNLVKSLRDKAKIVRNDK